MAVRRVAAVGVLLIGTGIVLAGTPAIQRRIPVDTYRVVRVFPHDPNAFTQGLVFRNGVLYESTGSHQGRTSTLRKVRLETGEILQTVRLDQVHFGEGLAELNGQLVQLTWQSKVAFAYDLATLALRRTFTYAGEGWGLASDGRRFVLSDGSEYLRFFDPATFRETGRIAVVDGNTRVRQLNELEFVKGEIYANIWHSDRIARINPLTGRVNGWIDLTGVIAGYPLSDSEAVLNGIAHDPASGRLFVTGKLWPRLFEIEVIPGK
jgi:glutamine cyclotransferase